MYREQIRDAGLVDHGTVEDHAQQAGKHCKRAALEVDSSQICHIPAIPLVRSQLREGTAYGHRRAPSFLERFQFWRAFAQSEFINRSLPGLAMNLKLEPVLQNGLHHGALHHQYARLAVRSGVDIEPL